MSIQTSQEFESYLPVDYVVPEQWEEGRQFLVENLKKISNAVNVREIGWFLDEELLSGKQFFPGVVLPGNNPGVFRTILRKVIDFGGLPAAGTKSVPHGLIVNVNFSLINMWLAATDPVNFVGFGLSYYSIAAGDIKLNYDVTNVNVTVASDYSAYTRAFVIIEYIQEL